MTPELQRQSTRLFIALEYGEQLAKDCALRQVSMFEDSRAKRFLKMQAKQESFHANFFSKAADFLSEKHHYKAPVSLLKFRAKLDSALTRGDLIESLIGQQIVLEGFGEQILMRLNKSMDMHGVGFNRMRELLLKQEQSHQSFGDKTLLKLVSTDYTSRLRVQVLVDEYMHIIESIVYEMSDVFVSLDADADNYINGVKNSIPDWFYSVE